MNRLMCLIMGVGLLLGGCDVNEPPPPSLIDDVPVITLGEDTQAEGDYILFVPGDESLPVAMSVDGSFLAQTASVTAEIRVQQDLYIYKQWSSFDGRNWQASHRLFDTRMRAGLTPGGVAVNVQFNRADK